jgi:glutamate-ammonia-ligase adenylyltransferase
MPPISPVNLLLADSLPAEDLHAHLASLGFRDPVAAVRNLRGLGDDAASRPALSAVAGPLIEAIGRAPDPDGALVGLSRYLAGRPDRASFLQARQRDPASLGWLVEILGTSPFLAEILIRHGKYFDTLLGELGPDVPLVPAADEEFAAGFPSSSSLVLFEVLKRLKRRHILRIATRDILGRDSLQQATSRVSSLADWLVQRALDVVLRDRLAAERRARPPGTFVVIGMGKLGGGELNYSSDIDLMYVYEVEGDEDESAHGFFHRLARKLTEGLSAHSAEGYLYRVDLRLRPMGRSGSIAHTLSDLRVYYPTWGATFERFALIKARPIAGHLDLGQRFLDAVRPFVYRAYLDFAAVEEMYQYKARIDRAIERAEGDRNVKVGPGGIREVELFTQVLQLTYGARHPELQQSSTLAGLEALQRTGLITAAVAEALTNAYIFLRTVEHRLQLVHETQTHALARNRDQLAIAARRLRFGGAEELEAALKAHRERVHEVYQGLFERRPGTEDFEARQFFRILGEEIPDEEAVGHLAGYGFRDPASALATIRDLGREALTATSPGTARNVLANLLAAWRPRLTTCAHPERVLMRFEQLSAETGAAAPLARTLLDQHVMRDVLTDVLDSGELLALRLIRNPELLDALVREPSSADELEEVFQTALHAMDELDRREAMRQVRRFKQREEFKLLVGWLASGSLDRLQEGLSVLASRCTASVAQWHAPSRGDAGAWVVLGLGTLGGEELTVHSDLDLVTVYEDSASELRSDLRWQSFVEIMRDFLSRATEEGIVYRIDTRLRPEGTKGPLAIPLAAFRRYLETRAEPWERMAWTRARVVAGSTDLALRVMDAVNRFVYGRWDTLLPQYMAHVRTRMEREVAREGATRLDFKTGRGGLSDIDFLLQLVQIREGPADARLRTGGTRRLLASLPPTAWLSQAEREQLVDAHRFLRTLELFVRMEADSSVSWFRPDPDWLAPLGVRMRVPSPEGQQLLSKYKDTTSAVRSIYTSVLTRLAASGHPGI